MRANLWLLVVFALWLVSPGLAMSVDDEIRIGAQAAAQFEAKYGVVTDPAYAGRLERIAQSMLPYVQRRDVPWRFRVIAIDQFNAAAFPGGFIYATRGLMDGLTDEELAFVVGHEIAHVDYRHSVKRLESERARRLGLIAIVAGASGGRVTDTTAALVGLADGVISSQFSKADESDSDGYGLRLMGQAGYDPVFALSALQKLAAQSSGGTPGFLNTLVGSHPLPKDRVQAGIAQIPAVSFQAQALPPVGAQQPSRSTPSGSRPLLEDGARSLEYTLSLAGHGFDRQLQSLAEGVAQGRANPPAGLRALRQTGARAEGLTALESALLTDPRWPAGKQRFGAAVVDLGDGRIEVVLLLSGEGR